ncbi:Hypothetical protein, putative [Bodo saltans]|uniref:Uncharacterized protein n=1 Tax=Bodo saltans TaxID=75058 RepID=A0A0S4JK49_BODSA|nr:Hypothetical protein, putative [Bodo saltans]|eukprot:CUG91849.1 Hypothetical protein, putative [Bodo saltans]
MARAPEIDYERILLELHREDAEDDHARQLSFMSGATPSHASSAVVWPPPSKGMMEDNSFLYERGHQHHHHHESTPAAASVYPTSSMQSNYSSYLVDTPKQQTAMPGGLLSNSSQHVQTRDRATTQQLRGGFPTTTSSYHQHKQPQQSHEVVAAAAAAPRDTLHPSAFAALEQIEMLNLDKKQLKMTIQTLHKQLEHFHDIVGPDLDKFHTDQVKLREEVMRLREDLRLTQQREHDAKGRCKDLELALMKLEQGGRSGASSDADANAPEARLAHLQDAIAKAYVQRSALLRERESVIAMRDAIEWRQKALEGLQPDGEGSDGIADASGMPPGVISDAGGSLSHWRIRGKEAELDKNLQQKETLIASLTAAAKEIEAVLDDTRSRGHQGKLSQLNARCPGCGKGQWNSPFCSATGHPHAGFTQKGNTEGGFGDIPPPRRVTAAEMLANGEWRKVVEVETSHISFEEVSTGRIVGDLEVELEAQYRAAVKAAKNTAEAQKPPTLPADAVIVGGDVSGKTKPLPPGIDKEMRLLLSTLKERNEEIQRLKALLQRMLDNGGLAALPHTQHPDAAPYPGAMPPLRELPHSNSLSAEDSMSLLKETNEHLNQRCAELAVVAQGREQKIAFLTQEISRLRFGSDT